MLCVVSAALMPKLFTKQKENNDVKSTINHSILPMITFVEGI
jgi:hypothetical protein